jgi:hypothetical protein
VLPLYGWTKVPRPIGDRRTSPPLPNMVKANNNRRLVVLQNNKRDLSYLEPLNRLKNHCLLYSGVIFER